MKSIQDGLIFDQMLKQRKKESIDQLMAEKKVQDLLKQNNLTREFVEMNWIDFLDYVDDEKQCRDCKGIEMCKKNFKGYMRLLTVENGQVSRQFIACPYGKKEDEKRRMLSHLTYNVPIDLLLTTMNEINSRNDGNMIEVLSRFIDDLATFPSKGIYLYGEMGTGKTYVLAAFCNALASKGIDCAFISMPQLLADLKSQFNTSDENNPLEKLKQVQVLILDDIGAETLSAWGRDDVLYTLLNDRMNRKLPTYFTSFYRLDELESHYIMSKAKDEQIKARRIIERVKALSHSLELFGKNFR